jgi:hypothetical protein
VTRPGGRAGDDTQQVIGFWSTRSRKIHWISEVMCLNPMTYAVSSPPDGPRATGSPGSTTEQGGVHHEDPENGYPRQPGMHPNLAKRPPTAPTRGEKTKMSRFAYARSEPGFGFCTKNAAEIRSRFSCWSTKMRFRRPGWGTTSGSPSGAVWNSCPGGPEHHDGGTNKGTIVTTSSICPMLPGAGTYKFSEGSSTRLSGTRISRRVMTIHCKS